MFKLESAYSPTWDQPQAIKQILDWFSDNKNQITLLWATGTGKTFTMANVIKELNKPTLVISHNKTLAAQLATEFKYFFPDNAVHYFVSYFDYYQPEAYLAEKDVYIEKESTINKEIEMYRLSAMASLLTRKDVIIVSSVSALYGLGTKDAFQKNMLQIIAWKEYEFSQMKRQLLAMQYKPVQWKIEQWMFEFRGEILDIYSSTDKYIYRLFFNEEYLERIQIRDSDSFKDLWYVDHVFIWPANQFLQDVSDLENILEQIKSEMEIRVKDLKDKWNLLEATRLEKKTMYDIRMIKETWFTNWIENYSLYFDKRLPWQPPSTIFNYFPEDMLMIVDESHMSLPQLRAMPSWDRSRKLSLIEHGFRLPSAIDHRPLNFEELEVLLWWKKKSSDNIMIDDKAIKSWSKTIFVSATPSEYELNLSQRVVQQIIRPTGLLDPITYIYPKSW